MRSTRALAPAIATMIAACAIALAGSAQGEMTSRVSARSRAVATAANAAPVNLMTIYEQSGPAPTPEVPEGALAAVKALNAAGGIDGHHVNLIVCVDGGNPTTTAGCARKAIASHVVALVGSCSIFSAVYLPAIAAAKIASIGEIPAGSADFTSPAAFPIGPGPVPTFANLARFLADQGARRIVLVRPDESAAAAAGQAANLGLRSLHLQIAAQIAVPLSAPDMSTYVAQALSDNADGVEVVLPQAQAVPFVKDLRQQAPRVKIGLSATGNPIGSIGRADATGIVQAYANLPVPGTKNAAATEFTSQMHAAGYTNLSGYRLNSWLSVEVVAKLAAGLKHITAAALWQRANAASGIETGLMPPLQWQHGGVGGAPRSFTGCALDVVQTASGQTRAVTGKFFSALANRNCPTPSAT